jgi:hypothetical protein
MYIRANDRLTCFEIMEEAGLGYGVVYAMYRLKIIITPLNW